MNVQRLALPSLGVHPTLDVKGSVGRILTRKRTKLSTILLGLVIGGSLIFLLSVMFTQDHANFYLVDYAVYCLALAAAALLLFVERDYAGLALSLIIVVGLNVLDFTDHKVAIEIPQTEKGTYYINVNSQFLANVDGIALVLSFLWFGAWRFGIQILKAFGSAFARLRNLRPARTEAAGQLPNRTSSVDLNRQADREVFEPGNARRYKQDVFGKLAFLSGKRNIDEIRKFDAQLRLRWNGKPRSYAQFIEIEVQKRTQPQHAVSTNARPVNVRPGGEKQFVNDTETAQGIDPEVKRLIRDYLYVQAQVATDNAVADMYKAAIEAWKADPKGLNAKAFIAMVADATIKENSPVFDAFQYDQETLKNGVQTDLNLLMKVNEDFDLEGILDFTRNMWRQSKSTQDYSKFLQQLATDAKKQLANADQAETASKASTQEAMSLPLPPEMPALETVTAEPKQAPQASDSKAIEAPLMALFDRFKGDELFEEALEARTKPPYRLFYNNLMNELKTLAAASSKEPLGNGPSFYEALKVAFYYVAEKWANDPEGFDAEVPLSDYIRNEAAKLAQPQEA